MASFSGHSPPAKGNGYERACALKDLHPNGRFCTTLNGERCMRVTLVNRHGPKQSWFLLRLYYVLFTGRQITIFRIGSKLHALDSACYHFGS